VLEGTKVDPDLVIRDHEGKPYTVRYEQINAMLLNELFKSIARSRSWKRLLQNSGRVSNPRSRNSINKLRL
jgi:hypothetical protein